MRHILLFLFPLALFLSCGPDKDQLKDEVIAIHDEVMPHMGRLQSLQKELAEEADLLALEDSVVNFDQIALLRNTSTELGLAYEGMFVWMRQFEPEQGEMTKEEYEAYLNEQIILVETVKEDINQALEKGERLAGAN